MSIQTIKDLDVNDVDKNPILHENKTYQEKTKKYYDEYFRTQPEYGFHEYQNNIVGSIGAINMKNSLIKYRNVFISAFFLIVSLLFVYQVISLDKSFVYTNQYYQDQKAKGKEIRGIITDSKYSNGFDVYKLVITNEYNEKLSDKFTIKSIKTFLITYTIAFMVLLFYWTWRNTSFKWILAFSFFLLWSSPFTYMFGNNPWAVKIPFYLVLVGFSYGLNKLISKITENIEDRSINETTKMNEEYRKIKESKYDNIKLKYGKVIHLKVVNELKQALDKMKVDLIDKYSILYRDTKALVQTFDSLKITYDQKMYKLVYQSESDCRIMFKQIEKPLNDYVKELRSFEQIANMLTARSYKFECIEMTALKKLYQDFQGFVLANLEKDKDYQMVRSQLNTENVAKESLKTQKEELQKQTELAKAKYILEQQRLEEQRQMEQDLKYKLDKSIQKQEEQKENINELKEEIEDLKRPKKW